MGQAIRDPLRIAGCKQQVAEPRSLAGGKSAYAFRSHAARDPTRQPTEMAEARKAPAGDTPVGPIGPIAVVTAQCLTIPSCPDRP